MRILIFLKGVVVLAATYLFIAKIHQFYFVIEAERIMVKAGRNLALQVLAWPRSGLYYNRTASEYRLLYTDGISCQEHEDREKAKGGQ